MFRKSTARGNSKRFPESAVPHNLWPTLTEFAVHTISIASLNASAVETLQCRIEYDPNEGEYRLNRMENANIAPNPIDPMLVDTNQIGRWQIKVHRNWFGSASATDINDVAITGNGMYSTDINTATPGHIITVGIGSRELIDDWMIFTVYCSRNDAPANYTGLLESGYIHIRLSIPRHVKTTPF